MNLHERLKAIVEACTHSSRRYKELEELTGVAAATWKTYWARGVRPSAEMLEGMAKAFPSLCVWLMTGKSSLGEQQYDLQTFQAIRKYDIGEIIRKENPSQITDEELLVVSAEKERSRYAHKILANLVDEDEFWLFEEARENNKTKGEVLRERRLRRDAEEEFWASQNPSYKEIKELEKSGKLAGEFLKLMNKKTSE